MNKEDYLKELNKAFGDFKFYQDGHYYTYKDKPISIGATGLIEQYTQDFDAQAVAEKVAEKQNISVQEVLNDWEYKNKFACIKGSTCHEYAQSRWSGEEYKPLFFDKSMDYLDAVAKIQQQAVKFYNDYNDRLLHLADEYVIGSEEYDIASAIDHLFINKLTGGLVLVDYKTNSDIHKTEKYAKNMKVPLSHLKDYTLNHYYIQLSIYKYLVEKYTNLKIEEMFIVWFSENIDNYEIIEIPYLKKEVEEILENRRVKNMKSIAVLVLGKSGSGKSSSLRNLKPEEYSLVNPLKKELPFKTNVKGLESDNYELIKKFITETPKKIVVIDDSNYLLTNQFMRNHSKGGSGNAVFSVYNEIGDNYWGLVQHEKNLDGGKIIFNFMHEEETESGNIIPKTIGKLLNEKVCIEGMYTIVIRAMYKDGKHIFRLKTDGNDCVKTPIGMFEEEECDNDLKYIIEKIREYYELDKNESEDK
jgi:hypothetical protein